MSHFIIIAIVVFFLCFLAIIYFIIPKLCLLIIFSEFSYLTHKFLFTNIEMTVFFFDYENHDIKRIFVDHNFN